MDVFPSCSTPGRGAVGIVFRLSVATVFSMSLWFSATAVTPALAREWQLSATQSGWLTTAVQLGFVVGTLISSFLVLADRVPTRILFAVSSFLAALANALLVLVDGIGVAVSLRFLTGALLAGVYPPGMKLAASWFTAGRGLAVGALVGAVTLGAAAPHLFGALAAPDGLGPAPWRNAVLGVSLLAVIGGLMVLVGVREGPYTATPSRFEPGAVRDILSERGVLLANVGYLGHMWELYAMWTWVPAFLLEVFQRSHAEAGPRLASGATFAVIAAGAPACLIAGYLADRIGRTAVVMASLAVSGTCASVVGSVGAGSAVPAVTLCLLWGFMVVADSAQFSTMVTELAPRRYIGTALTLQTALGFSLTTVTLQTLPWLEERASWPSAFALLALGPAVGIVAMLRLRRLPESGRLALGKK